MGDVPLVLLWRQALCSERCRLSSTCRLVAHTAACHAAPDGTGVRPGAPLLSRESGLSVRAVRAALSTLVDSGWLETVARGGKSGTARKANEYRLVIPNGCRTVTRERGSPVNLTTLTPAPPAPQYDQELANRGSSSAALTGGAGEAVDYQSGLGAARANLRPRVVGS